MDDFTLLASLIFFSVISAMLAHKFAGMFDFRYLTVMGLFILKYSFNFFGGLVIFFQLQNTSDDIRHSYISMIFLGFIGVCVGATLVSMLTKYNPKKAVRFLSSKFELSMSLSSMTAIFIFMVICGGLVLIVYSMFVPTIPILYMLSSDSDALVLKDVRAFATKTVPQYATHPMNFFRLVLFPYLVILAFLLVYRFRRTDLKFLFIFVLVSGLIFNSYTTALYPVALLFAVIGLAAWIVRAVKLRWFIILSVLVFAFPVFTIGIYSSQSLIDLVKRVILHVSLERFAYTVPELLLDHVRLFWDNKLEGAGHRPLAIILGKEPVNVSNMVYLYRDPTDHYLGQATVPFIGPLYADFGLWGVALGSIAAGIILQGAQIYVVHTKRTLMNLALYIAVVWMAGFAAPSTNITTGLISKGVLPVLFIPPTLQALGGLISRPNPTLRRQTRELMSQ